MYYIYRIHNRDMSLFIPTLWETKFYIYRFGTLRSTRSPQQVYFTLMTFFRLSRNGLCSLFSTVHREHLLAWATGSGNTDSRGCQSLHPKMTQTS